MNFDLCHVGVTKPQLTQVLLLCKCSYVGFIIGPHKSTVQCYLNPKFKFLHTND
jgi:hypothetical protein